MKPYHPLLLGALLVAGCATSAATFTPPPLANAALPAPGIIAAGRIAPDDVTRLQEAGIRQVIDLTHDSETSDFDEATAIRDAGMAYANLPLRGAEDLTPDNVRAFDVLLRDAQRPLLVHCASSNRVGAMAALRAAWIEGKPVDEAVAIGKAWGLKGLEGAVREALATD